MLKLRYIDGGVRLSKICCWIMSVVFLGVGVCFGLDNCSKEIGERKPVHQKGQNN